MRFEKTLNKFDEFVFNERTMRGFATFLRGRENASSTIQRRLDGVSAFWKFLRKCSSCDKPLPRGH
jgi:hypothetical protein